jgi:hypothetical protein
MDKKTIYILEAWKLIEEYRIELSYDKAENEPYPWIATTAIPINLPITVHNPNLIGRGETPLEAVKQFEHTLHDRMGCSYRNEMRHK